MQARRKEARTQLRSSKAHSTRMQLIKSANGLLHKMDVDSAPSGHIRTDINDDTSAGTTSVFATKTKPAMSKYQQKRLGAKKAKKLEVAANSSFVLSPNDATMYRALAARCNYLSQDRPNISFASKELCHEFSVPNHNSFKQKNASFATLQACPD